MIWPHLPCQCLHWNTLCICFRRKYCCSHWVLMETHLGACCYLYLCAQSPQASKTSIFLKFFLPSFTELHRVMSKILSCDCNHTIFVFCKLITQMPNECSGSVLRTARVSAKGILFYISFLQNTCKCDLVLNLGC